MSYIIVKEYLFISPSQEIHYWIPPIAAYLRHNCLHRGQIYSLLPEFVLFWSINSLWLCDAIWPMWVHIGSGNGLLPNGTKPLLESMLTSGVHLKSISLCAQAIINYENHILEIPAISPRGQWVNELTQPKSGQQFPNVACHLRQARWWLPGPIYQSMMGFILRFILNEVKGNLSNSTMN